MGKKVVLFFLFAGIFVGQANAQNEGKIDTLLQNQKKILQNQSTILQNVRQPYVLEGKRMGVAFNPALALFGVAIQQAIVSGSMSLFPHKGTEIIFPVYFSHSLKKDDDRDILTVDAQYRLFFNAQKPGFFSCAGARLAYLMGRKNVPYNVYSQPNRDETTSVTKFGVYFGIGYRYFGSNGLYWGTELILGSYFSDDSDKFDDSFIDASRFLFDVTFLRVGYAF